VSQPTTLPRAHRYKLTYRYVREANVSMTPVASISAFGGFRTTAPLDPLKSDPVFIKYLIEVT
jgi:hypothetical protein